MPLTLQVLRLIEVIMVKELFYTTTQAAEQLGMHPVYVRALCESKKIHATKTTAKGYWRISVKELRRYMLQRKGGKK